jgi:hypothetical protein
MATAEKTEQVNLNQNSVLIRVTAGKPGNFRRLSKAQMAELATDENQQDTESLRAQKCLFDCPEYTAIAGHLAGISLAMRENSIPSTLFSAGVYRVPIARVQRVEDKLHAQLDKLNEELIPAFLDRYDEIVQEALDACKFRNELDYLPKCQVAGRIYLSWRYIEVGIPGAALSVMGPAFAAQERAKARAEIANELDEMRYNLREMFSQTVAYVLDRVSNFGEKQAGGKRKQTWKTNAMQEAFEFFRNSRDLNLTNDKELDALYDKLTNAMQGIDTDALKASATQRARLVDIMASVKPCIDSLLKDAPSRVITALPD